ncbi:MAG: hypothetical protein ABR507_11120, partial [Actinomycetota bacterium]
LIGRGSVGTRLGFVRGETKGPLLFKIFFEWLERRAIYVEWQDVVLISKDKVVVRNPPGGFVRYKDIT